MFIDAKALADTLTGICGGFDALGARLFKPLGHQPNLEHGRGAGWVTNKCIAPSSDLTPFSISSRRAISRVLSDRADAAVFEYPPSRSDMAPLPLALAMCSQ